MTGRDAVRRGGWRRVVAAGLVAAAAVVCGVAGPVVPPASAAVTAIDLGTLGGTYSQANAVSGNIVVGSADTAGGASHAFAYDLGAASPVMRDLGTLGGTNSEGDVVSGNIVAGWAETAGDAAEHAFAYDLGAASPAMRDLGTLGGTNSYANSVSGNIVVGRAYTAANAAYHAVAWVLLTDTVTGLASSANPVAAGSRVVYTATVTPVPAGGTVGFADNGVPVPGCQAVPVSGGTARCGVTYQGSGGHTIVASYSGAADYAGSVSPSLAETVLPAPPHASPSGPGPVVIVTAGQLPGGAAGHRYGVVLAASGGVPPYTWSLVSGHLPPGLALSPAGVISGIPAAGGRFWFVLKVTDGRGASAAGGFTLAVSGDSGLYVSLASPGPLRWHRAGALVINVGNNGRAATPPGTPVQVGLTVPAGLQITSAGSGPSWHCQARARVVTCARLTAIGPGAVSVITVPVWVSTPPGRWLTATATITTPARRTATSRFHVR